MSSNATTNTLTTLPSTPTPQTSKEVIAANVKLLIEQLEAGHSEGLTAYLTAMGRFHNYSFGNILEIARQKPDATRVAGLYAWNQLGRKVMKGQNGIRILAPMIGIRRKKDKEAEKDITKQNRPVLVGFRAAYVFDVSQTEGADLPDLKDRVKGDVGEYQERLLDFIIAQGIELEFKDSIAPALGMSYGGKIVILPGQSPAETFACLVHEVSHELLHKSERRTATTKTVRETEAEAIAFVVSQTIGLDAGNAACDQCLDSACYHGKVEAFLDREIAAHPGLVQIENGWRNPKEQRPGALQRGHVRELETVIDNPDAEPVMPCEAAKPAIVVYGKQLGRKLTVCTDKHCPVHDPQAAAEAAAHPVPTMAPAPEVETEEEAAQREAEHEQRMAGYKAEQERKEKERKAEFERQQKEYEAEQARRDKQRRARVATFDRIIEQAPASFNPSQMRVFLRLLIHLDYSFLEEVANHFANGDENSQLSDDEIVLAALDGIADEKLSGLALRLVLSDHVGIPNESQPDLLSEAEHVFAPKKPKVVKAKTDGSNKPKPTAAKATPKKETTRKKAA